jgi:glycosyltransferase involved in cell wall biosynthesis
MRIVQIAPQIDNMADGMAYSIPRLASALAEQGADSILMTLGNGTRVVKGVKVERYRVSQTPLLSRLRSSDSLSSAIRKADATVDVFHGHGLWQMPGIYPTYLANSQTKTILSPRGMLGAEALEFSKWRKRGFWWLIQRGALERCAALHATSLDEYEAIRSAGLTRPVAVIPNGIDLPDLDRPKDMASKTVVSLGRLHPKKGLDRLIRAWSKLNRASSDWRLRIIGPNEGSHRDELERLVNELHLTNVSIEGPVFAAEKWRTLREADIFVLPTLNENFALTVAEALASETPVISTKGAPWQRLDEKKCGWWVEHGVEHLAQALKLAMNIPPRELKAMGQRGREWMAHEYSWNSIAAATRDVYLWVQKRGPRPETIQG